MKIAMIVSIFMWLALITSLRCSFTRRWLLWSSCPTFTLMPHRLLSPQEFLVPSWFQIHFCLTKLLAAIYKGSPIPQVSLAIYSCPSCAYMNICAGFAGVARWEVYHLMQLQPKEQLSDPVEQLLTLKTVLWIVTMVKKLAGAERSQSYYPACIAEVCVWVEAKRARWQKLYNRNLKGALEKTNGLQNRDQPVNAIEKMKWKRLQKCTSLYILLLCLYLCISCPVKWSNTILESCMNPEWQQYMLHLSCIFRDLNC